MSHPETNRHAGFIIHPLSSQQLHDRLVEKSKLAKWVTPGLAEAIGYKIPFERLDSGHMNGIYSDVKVRDHHPHVDTAFQAVALTPNWIINNPEKAVEVIVETGRRLSESCEIVGLGAFTSIAGRQGKGMDVVARSRALGYETIYTTGNSLTTWCAIQSLLDTARKVGHNLEECTVGVLGATGSIGRACCFLLREAGVKHLLICARNPQQIMQLAEDLGPSTCDIVFPEVLIARSNLIVAVTSDIVGFKVDENLFRPGTIICDVARPRNFANLVHRNDVLVHDGGLMRVPRSEFVNQTVNLMLPPGIVPGCTAETQLLALMGAREHWSIGQLDPDKVQELGNKSVEHGFTIAGIRVGDREIPDSALDPIRASLPLLRR